jgi:hypothetical protein
MAISNLKELFCFVFSEGIKKHFISKNFIIKIIDLTLNWLVDFYQILYYSLKNNFSLFLKDLLLLIHCCRNPYLLLFNKLLPLSTQLLMVNIGCYDMLSKVK